jgi:Domain of unknown function (DUF4440)
VGKTAFLSALFIGVILSSGAEAMSRGTAKTTLARSKGGSSSRPAHTQQTTAVKSPGTSPGKNSTKDSTKESKASAKAASLAPLDNSKAAFEAIEVERITGLEKESLEADLKKDQTWFQDYLADDLTRVTPDGVFEDKARLTARSLDPANVVESKTYDELTVRPYGEDVMIATGRLSLKGKSNNAEYTEQRTFTHVWVNRLGQWQEVAIQESPIVPGDSPSQPGTASASQMQRPEEVAPSPLHIATQLTAHP